MQPDSPLARVRKARCRISAQFGNDPKRLVEHYMELQERHRERLARSTERPFSTEASDMLGEEKSE
jgi:hypothetical protein